MKIAIALLFVALSYSFGSGDANAVKKGPGYATGGNKVPSKGPIFPKDCLEKLVKIDIPQALERLQNMLCLYMTGRKTHNEKLYKEFLCEVHAALKDAGCSVDQLLSLPQLLEQIGDSAGKAAEEVGVQILIIVENLGISDAVMDCLCKLLGETLKSLSQSLGGLVPNLNVAGGALKALPIPLPLTLLG